GFVTRSTSPYSTCLAVGFDRSLAAERFRREFDRVDYLNVPGATAVMHAEDTIDLVVSWFRLLVNQVFGADNDARRAESTLQPAAGNETVCERVAFKLAEPFQCKHSLSGNVPGGHRARDHRPAVYDDRATSALAVRAAAILWRDHST